MKLKSKYINYLSTNHIWKHPVQNAGHFVQASLCSSIVLEIGFVVFALCGEWNVQGMCIGPGACCHGELAGLQAGSPYYLPKTLSSAAIKVFWPAFSLWHHNLEASLIIASPNFTKLSGMICLAGTYFTKGLWAYISNLIKEMDVALQK